MTHDHRATKQPRIPTPPSNPPTALHQLKSAAELAGKNYQTQKILPSLADITMAPM